MSGDDAHLLETAIRAARTGGQLALERLDNPGYQKWKGPRDLLAGAVLDIQAGIVEVIRQEFPDHHLLVEESEEPQDEQADPLWIIDPLDGSVNFFRGIPFFAISVGFRVKGRYRIGVVYDPCRDELFQAVFNGGAFLNGRQIRVAKFAGELDSFQVAVVGTDWSGNQDEVKRAFQLSRVVASEVLQVRTLGSPALGLCYVATGRLDAYYGLDHIKLWDIAAGSVILKEAGGAITNIDGGPWLQTDEEGYLATNGNAHTAMKNLVSSMRKLQLSTSALHGRK